MALERKAMAEAVGVRIRDERTKRGWSQEDAAREFEAHGHVTSRNWQKWEKGEVLPHPENLRALALLFELEVPELLGQDEQPPGDFQAQLNRIEEKIDRLLEAQAAERVAQDVAAAGRASRSTRAGSSRKRPAKPSRKGRAGGG